MDLKIEKMTLDDLNSIQNILFTEFDNFWTFSAFKQELNSENSHFIVAKNNDEIVGFAGMLLNCEEIEIMNIVIKKSERGKGIGKILLQILETVLIPFKKTRQDNIVITKETTKIFISYILPIKETIVLFCIAIKPVE